MTGLENALFSLQFCSSLWTYSSKFLALSRDLTLTTDSPSYHMSQIKFPVCGGFRPVTKNYKTIPDLFLALLTKINHYRGKNNQNLRGSSL